MKTNTPHTYTNAALKDKIAEMYSEISTHGISVSFHFSTKENADVVKFEKGAHALTTHLAKKDADECMYGIKCVYLGVQIGEFLKNFEEGERN